MRRALIALAVLAGCATEPEIAPLPSFRDTSVPIASQVDVALADLEGQWHARGAVGTAQFWTTVAFDSTNMTLRTVRIPNCPEGLECAPVEGVDAISQFGQGRFNAAAVRLAGGGRPEDIGAQEYWILWADFDRRTMAIGNPAGTFGLILDRNPTGGEDRIAAARDIMRWMGYRVDELEVGP